MDLTVSPALIEAQDQALDRPARPLDRLAALALLYLSLPVLLFLAGWFKLPVAMALTALACFGLRYALLPVFTGAKPKRQLPSAGTFGVLIGAALLWSVLGGAGHFVYANDDWIIRDAVLRDLTVSAWPPRYGSDGISDIILRAPVAYYLPAATLGTWFGLQWADTFLWLWTFLGVAIFLLLLPLPAKADLRLVLVLPVVALFSGMDIVGWLAFWPQTPQLGDHLEWWARLFQFSSNTTQLFWVPNHALPAWIAAALFYRHWRHPDFAGYAPMLFATLALWSPFAAIGMVPFYVALAAHWAVNRNGAICRWQALVPALAVMAVCGLFLTLGLGTVPTRSAVTGGGQWPIFLQHYVPFIALECGFIVLVLFLLRADKLLLAVSLVTLLLLPLVRMGPGNDIVMRGSIPALTMICLLTVVQLQRKELFHNPLLGLSLLAILSIGAVTPLQEFYRAFAEPRWDVEELDLITVSHGVPPLHYMARLNQPALIWLFKKPENVPRAY